LPSGFEHGRLSPPEKSRATFVRAKRNNLPDTTQQARPELTAEALGVLDVIGLTPSIYALDRMLKAAPVHLAEIEYSGGLEITTKILGETEAVRQAVEVGVQAAGDAYRFHTWIPNPARETGIAVWGKLRYIGILSAYSKLRYIADEPVPVGDRNSLGLLETVGYLPVVAATDEMLKSAHVDLIRSEKVGGMMGSVFLYGETGAIVRAIRTGREVVERIGTPLVGAFTIERPHEEIQAVIYGTPPAPMAGDLR
jgi:microcompartment protein CcmL/EutN